MVLFSATSSLWHPRNRDGLYAGRNLIDVAALYPFVLYKK
jgi:hypothetical protein